MNIKSDSDKKLDTEAVTNQEDEEGQTPLKEPSEHELLGYTNAELQTMAKELNTDLEAVKSQ